MHSYVSRVRVMFSDWRKLMRISRLDFDISWGVCNTLHDNGETRPGQYFKQRSDRGKTPQHCGTIVNLHKSLRIESPECPIFLLHSKVSHATLHPSDCTQMEKEYSSEYTPVTVSWWCWYGWAQCAAGDSICNDILAIDRLSGACISTLTPHCHNQSTVSGDDQSIMMFRCSLVFIWEFLVDEDGYSYGEMRRCMLSSAVNVNDSWVKLYNHKEGPY